MRAGIILAAICSLFVSGPVRADEPRNTEIVSAPKFEVKVALSRLAQEKLSRIHETIIVATYYEGEPKPDSNLERDEQGLYQLGVDRVEINGPGIAEISSDLPVDKIEELKDRDYTVLVNVFTGRHTTSDNLLDCDIVSGSIGEIQGKVHDVSCKLIYGE